MVDLLGRSRFPARDQALFILGVRAGFRISELLSLTLGDVYQNGNFVSRVTVQRQYMKGKLESRNVPLHSQARAFLERLVRELLEAGLSDPQTPLFRSREGKNRAIHRSSAWRLLTQAAAKLGLTGKLGTHCLRKTFARRVHEKGGRDLMKTQKAMRHKRITSTVEYLSFNEEEVDDAILKS